MIKEVRFLGTTLWTSFGNWHPDLIRKALQRMNDYLYIRATAWYASHQNRVAFRRYCKSAGFITLPDCEQHDDRHFHPVIAFLEHKRSVLKRMLHDEFEGPTIVVTHHAPTMASVRAYGVPEHDFDPKTWSSPRPPDGVLRIAAYATVLDDLLSDSRSAIDAWVHGHLHAAVDLACEGVRVISNPRGYAITRIRIDPTVVTPLLDDASASEGGVSNAQYPGHARGFDPRLLLNLGSGLKRSLRMAVAARVTRMRALLADAQMLVPHRNESGTRVATMCIHRCLRDDVYDVCRRGEWGHR